MEHIYRLTGTLPELQEILQSQFGMEEKEAKFSVCLLLMEQQQTINEISDKDTALWYLHESEHFTTPILKSRISISFEDAKKNILDQLFIQFSGMLVDGESFAFTTVMSCLLAVYRSATYIQNRECCVYYQILNWKVTHATQEYFQVREIIPHNPEKVCSHLDLIKEGKWECNTCNNEQCNATVSSYSEILDGLCERKVLVKYNKMYRFAK
ncbi:hypothetical protein FMM74_012950 [Lachnospiraceae bacterium MD308]|nr:hypothetical protein [Lachnospiraceae bacterium MD308]MCI8580475.1 hypothetical protein [Dorea sp.]